MYLHHGPLKLLLHAMMINWDAGHEEQIVAKEVRAWKLKIRNQRRGMTLRLHCVLRCQGFTQHPSLFSRSATCYTIWFCSVAFKSEMRL